MKKPRRKHSKISGLPEPIVAEVNRLLTTPGMTYEKIVEHLRQLGHLVGKSSVGRYAQDFLTRLQHLREVKEQAKAIVEESGGNGMEMEEAATQIALQRTMEYLLNLKKEDFEGEALNKMISSLARLQGSSSMREHQKDLREKIKRAVKMVEEVEKKKNIDPADLQKIKQEFYGLTA